MTRPDDDTQQVPAVPRQAGTQHPTAELPTVDGNDDWTQPAPPPARTAGPRRVAGFAGLARVVTRGALLLAALVVLAMVVALAGGAVGLWPHLSNPFASRTTDRSQPVMLKSIKDLSRYVGASGNFQVVIDVQKDHKYIPDIIFSDRTLFVAAGTVDAYVDFSGVDNGALMADPVTKTVTLKLPAPQLAKPNIDHSRSYVFAERQGAINHISDLFGGDPNKEQQLYVLAEQRIAQAARQSGLADRAQQNTRTMLEHMFRSLGYTTINISFAQP